MSATMDAELEEVLGDLPPHDRQEVLEYARSLLDADDDDAAERRMVHMIGAISREDVRLMKEAIEEEGRTGILLVRFLGCIPDEDLQRMQTAARRDEAGDAEDPGAVSAAEDDGEDFEDEEDAWEDDDESGEAADDGA